jgi:hypothetical protein
MVYFVRVNVGQGTAYVGGQQERLRSIGDRRTSTRNAGCLRLPQHQQGYGRVVPRGLGCPPGFLCASRVDSRL